jgi:hypothetical protein
LLRCKIIIVVLLQSVKVFFIFLFFHPTPAPKAGCIDIAMPHTANPDQDFTLRQVH